MVPSSKINHEFLQTHPSIDNSYSTDQTLIANVEYLVGGSIPSSYDSEFEALGKDSATSLMPIAERCESEKPKLQHYDSLGYRVDDVITSYAWKQQHEYSAQAKLISTPYENNATAFSRLKQFVLLLLYAPGSGMYSCPLAMTDGATRLIRIILNEQHQLKKSNSTSKLLPQYTLKSLETAYKHLTSNDKVEFWTSGQWMTEQASGSDVSFSTRTMAAPIDSNGKPTGPVLSQYASTFETLPLLPNGDVPVPSFTLSGPNIGATHRLYGLKWFTSAVDAAISITLGRIVPPNFSGTEEEYKAIPLSCFLLFVRDENGKLNNIRVRKLKDKMGTRQLPTAELELHGTPAFLISEPGRGIASISHFFNITRCHNTLSALGFFQRMNALSSNYASTRKVFNTLLSENTLHSRTLARNMSTYAFTLLPALELGVLQGIVEALETIQNKQPNDQRYNTSNDEYFIALQKASNVFVTLSSFPFVQQFLSNQTKTSLTPEEYQAIKHFSSNLLRILTPLLKLYSAKITTAGCSEALEAFGALGYIEETPMPRIFRDAHVLPIWEGTTNVCSDDVLRTLRQSAKWSRRNDAAQSTAEKSIAKNILPTISSNNQLSATMSNATNSYQTLFREVSGRLELTRSISKQLESYGCEQISNINSVCVRIQNALDILDKYLYLIGLNPDSKHKDKYVSQLPSLDRNAQQSIQLTYARDMSFSIFKIYACTTQILYTARMINGYYSLQNKSVSVSPLTTFIPKSLLSKHKNVSFSDVIQRSIYVTMQESGSLDPSNILPYGLVDRSLDELVSTAVKDPNLTKYKQDLQMAYVVSHMYANEKENNAITHSKI